MKKRRAVDEVCNTLKVSERRVCRVLGQPRSTQRHRRSISDFEKQLRLRIVKLATDYGRYGYRRIHALLKREGWRINHKRVERIWREEGLKVPQKQPKRKRLWLNEGSCIRLKPEFKDHVWSYDFVAERLSNGKAIRLLTLIDEYSRECLAIKVGRSLKSQEVLDQLSELFLKRRMPFYI